MGGIVARLVEHNNSVSQYLAALIKGTATSWRSNRRCGRRWNKPSAI